MSVSPKYRTDIDGLRAVAVVPVVLYHAGFSVFSGGYVGVDVFFVISGFLITSLILPEIAESRFSFRSFYERRIRRLFPALFAVLLVSCIPALWLLTPVELEDFGQSVATTTVFSSNFLFFSENGYFEGPAEQKPLLHTWSLAIEEQYYLIFPALLLLIRKRLGGQFQRWTLGLFIASLALSVYSVQFHPTAAFYLLPSRTWELLLGSLLAMGIINASSHRPINEVLAWIGISLIGIAVFGYQSTTPFPGFAALLPCAGTALLIYSGQGVQTSVARLLSLRPLVLIGLISYSLYLWHWPVLVFAKHWLIREAHLWESLSLVALSVLLATLSWRYVEQPFRGKTGWFTQQTLFRLTGGVMLLQIAVGLIFDETEGLPQRLSPQVAQIAGFAEDKPPERKRCEGILPAELSYERLCRVTEIEQVPSFIVWGDSHAAAVMRAAKAAATTRKLNGLNATNNGCPPLLGIANIPRDPEGLCMDYNDRILELLKQHPEITTIVLMARWARHAEAVPYKQESGVTNLLRNRQRKASNVPENRAIFRQALEETMATLATLNRNVVVLGPIPEIGHVVPNSMAKAERLGRPVELRLPRSDFEQRSGFTRGALKEVLGPYPFTYRPLAQLFCDQQWCAIADNGKPLYSDGDHVSSLGADRTIGIFGELFDAAPIGESRHD